MTELAEPDNQEHDKKDESSKGILDLKKTIRLERDPMIRKKQKMKEIEKDKGKD